MNSEYHVPVLLNAVIEGLNIGPTGTFVDVTFGGGGHSSAILDRLTDGKLIAFDQDTDATNNLLQDDRLVFVRQNFRYLKNYLRMHRVSEVDGILADLGVSSHQFNEAERGFSIRYDAELDMRMDRKATLTAKSVINNYEEEALSGLLYRYGELKNARRIARAIVQHRESQSLNTVDELKAVVASFAPKHKVNQFYARVFQALRIEVNRELEVLEEMLQQAADVLKPGGRLVVISYHSLEDRLVKNFMKTGNFDGKLEKDFYGNPIRPLQTVMTKPIVPDEAEIERNSRARSAKLRIAQKL